MILSNVKQQCGPLPPGLNLIEIELFMQNASGLLYNPTMKQTNLRAGCKSALQPGTMTGRRSETFEDL